jgi:hypothetical protein
MSPNHHNQHRTLSTGIPTAATLNTPSTPTPTTNTSSTNTATNNNNNNSTVGRTSTASLIGPIIGQFMIITREKSRTYLLITRIPQVSNQRRNNHIPIPLTNVKIENKDSQLIEQVMQYMTNQYAGDHDIIYYQLIFQHRSKNMQILLPRSLILTQTIMMLCIENLYAVDIQMQILESYKLKDVHKVIVDDQNPMFVTIIFKKMNVLGNRKKWRISTDSRNASIRLVDECRRVCLDAGNKDV